MQMNFRSCMQTPLQPIKKNGANKFFFDTIRELEFFLTSKVRLSINEIRFVNVFFIFIIIFFFLLFQAPSVSLALFTHGKSYVQGALGMNLKISAWQRISSLCKCQCTALGWTKNFSLVEFYFMSELPWPRCKTNCMRFNVFILEVFMYKWPGIEI